MVQQFIQVVIMAKYTPIETKLSELWRNEFRASFAEIESFIDAPLPASARTHREWWANETGGSHVQARAWMNAGWNVSAVDLAKEWVIFRRQLTHKIWGIAA
ncbi:MAG: hypothetical protein CME88_10640 [Hirschia sp.]|nr:hypothetical protein [Hirschia sp.]MBF18824.1 hypothetical protein [Hirschia sp.]